MTKLILIRHGQSEANLEGIFVGHKNSPLSSLGKEQAQLTAEYIVNHFHVDEVYASDLSRAFETGKAVADRLSLKTVPDPRLREIFAGKWEGTHFSDLIVQFKDSYNTWLHDIGNAKCEGGETVEELMHRFTGALKSIHKENEGKTIVIATHATPIRTLMCHCRGGDLNEMKNIPWVSNASITVVHAENGELSLIEAGFDKHLGSIRTELPKNV